MNEVKIEDSANKNIEIERLTNENKLLKSTATINATVQMMVMMDTAKVKEDEPT